MQACHKVAQMQCTLSLGAQCQTSAAIDTLVGDVIAVVDAVQRAVNSDRPDRTSDVAHVIAADPVVTVADAVGLHIGAGQQQTGGLEPSSRQYEMPRRDGEALA